MAARCRSASRAACKSILWGVVGFACLNLLGGLALEKWLPAARDPEYSLKLRRLLALRQHDTPEPLILMLGSSRTLVGFNAEAAQKSCQEEPATVFNFGVNGGGPFAELLVMRR